MPASGEDTERDLTPELLLLQIRTRMLSETGLQSSSFHEDAGRDWAPELFFASDGDAERDFFG